MSLIFDDFKILSKESKLSNPLNINSYEKKWIEAKKLGQTESVEIGTAHIGGKIVDVGIFNPSFMMGSIGKICGDRIVYLFEHATRQKLPVVMIVSSGGARMQEGIVSLMQLQRISNAIFKHSSSGLLYVSLLCDPCMGGATASLGMQADIILGEKGATIGFAGKRVIQNTIHENIDNELQKSESLVQNGFIDCVVNREDEKYIINKILDLHQ
nr:carboxyl transferase domain-containing protein [Latilactobacillus sakei]